MGDCGRQLLEWSPARPPGVPLSVGWAWPPAPETGMQTGMKGHTAQRHQRSSGAAQGRGAQR